MSMFERIGSKTKTPETQETSSVELKRFLEKVDFDGLRTIFEEYRRKSGIAIENWHFVGPENIKATDLKNSYGFHETHLKHDFSANTSVVAHRGIILNPKDLKIGNDNESLLLHGLIHEETHAVSYEDSSVTGKNLVSNTSGYNRKEEEFLPDNMVSWQKFFRLFDEGVTELLAREITKKYLSFHPEIGTKTGRKFVTSLDERQGLLPIYRDIYQAEVDLVKSLIVRLSKIVGIEEKTVWEGIVRSKLEGFDFFEQSTKDIFEEMFGEGFVADLSDATTLGEVQNLTKRIEGETFTHDIGEVVRRKLFFLVNKASEKRGV